MIRRLLRLLAELRGWLGHPVVVTAAIAFVFGRAAANAGDVLVADTDVFWLAAVGRDIALHHAMPHVNGYSFADGAHPWVMHEGLFGLLLFQGLRALGPPFFTLYGLLAGCLTMLLALGWLFSQSRSPLAGGLAALGLLATAHAYFWARPLYASLSFVVAMVALVFRPRWSAARAVGVVLLELVWTNAHGSFGLGVLLVAAGAFDDGRSRRERRAWLATAGAAGLITLVNPYGLALHGLVDRYLRAADPTAAIIQTHIMSFEAIWDAILDGNFEGLALLMLLVVTVAAVRSLRRRKRVARAMVALVGVAMAVYQVRHVVLGILLGVLLLHGVVDDVVRARGASGPRRARRPVWMTAAVLIPALVVGTGRWRRAVATRAPLAWIHVSLGGEAFVRLLATLPDGARVSAPFKASALAIWYASPRGVKILYDPRNDCYSPDVAEGALELDWPHKGAPRGSRPVADFLEAYGTEYVLTTRGVIADDLARDAGWEVWRHQGDWTAFRRSRHP